MGFPQQAGYYLPAALPQPQRFFNTQHQSAMRGGQPRWPQQPRAANPQNQMMMAPNQMRHRGPNPRYKKYIIQKVNFAFSYFFYKSTMTILDFKLSWVVKWK